MAKIHTIHANGSLPKPTLWHKMHNYFTLVKNEINPRYKDLGGFKAAPVSAAFMGSLHPSLFGLHPTPTPWRLRGLGPDCRVCVSKQSWADRLNLRNLGPQLYTCVLVSH